MGGGKPEVPVGDGPYAGNFGQGLLFDRSRKDHVGVPHAADLERWYLVTFVIDNGAKECRLYLDGDRKKTILFTGTPKLSQPGRTLRIGDTGAGEHMDGVIDDVRIYKESLTDEQVRALAAP